MAKTATMKPVETGSEIVNDSNHALKDVAMCRAARVRRNSNQASSRHLTLICPQRENYPDFCDNQPKAVLSSSFQLPNRQLFAGFFDAGTDH